MIAGRLPNTYLIGAPKSGTTSLATYIAEHPDAFVGYPKEPDFWSTDLGRSNTVAAVETLEAYRRLYESAGEAIVVLDASTRYLLSDVAVPAVLDHVPDARFIVMLRSPAEVAQAYHMEKYFNRFESEPDFERAWHLQADRRAGRSIPARCPEPRELQYIEVAALGSQLARAMDRIPDGQLLVLFFDDLRDDPTALWRTVTGFLGLSDDGRIEFPQLGSAHFNRFPRVATLYQNPPSPMRPAVRFAKRMLREDGWGKRVGERCKKLLLERRERARLGQEFASELRIAFEPEIETIERLTGRDLTHWRGDP